jgi:hypothetical protein
MHKKPPRINSSKRPAVADAPEANDGRGAVGGVKSDGGCGVRRESAKPNGTTVALPAAGDEDLLLWALANGLEPEGGWYRALKLSRRDLKALSEEHRARFEQLRRMEVIGRLLFADQLAVLLRARLAQMLLAASGPKELGEALRVFEKLPAHATPADSDGADGAALNLELDEGELRETMDEARRLLKELEADPAVRRLLGPTTGNGEEPLC